MNSWNNQDFKGSILTQAKTKKLLKSEEYPAQIILNGWWSNVLRELCAKSRKEKKECSKNIKTNLSIDNLLISKNIAVGSEKRVRTIIEVNKNSSQTEKFIGMIHVHTDNSPFSFRDLSNFLFMPRDFVGFLVTRNRQIILAVRTAETPRLSGNQEEFIKKMGLNYKSFLNSDTKHLIANLLFCQENKIVFYLGKVRCFNKNEIILKKKTIRKKTVSFTSVPMDKTWGFFISLFPPLSLLSEYLRAARDNRSDNRRWR